MSAVRVVSRALVAVALCLPSLLLAAAPASAHAGLLDSDPADGARLDAAPRQVTLSFSEDIQRPAYVVVRAGGREVAAGEAKVAGPRVTQAVPSDAPSGKWSMAYRVVSTDGHPVTGELGFEVTAAPSETADPTATQEPTEEPAQGEAGAQAEAVAAESDDSDEGAWQLHGDHVLVGAGLLALAAVVLVVARRSR